LEPEWVRQSAQEFIAPIMMNDRFADHCTQARHTFGQPFWDLAGMQRQIGASGPSSHASEISFVGSPTIP
jgi:hypothetical protein